MDKGDIVRVKPNFHHPSRVGQTAKVIDFRVTGDKNPIQQCFVQFKDGQPDSIFEYDLELTNEQDLVDFVEEHVKEVEHTSNVQIPAKIFENPLISESADGKKVLNL